MVLVNGYGHTDQYGDDKEGKKEAIYDDRCETEEKRGQKVATRSLQGEKQGVNGTVQHHKGPRSILA